MRIEDITDPRQKAIATLYGAEAYDADETITLPDGEVIVAWVLDDNTPQEEFLSQFSIDIVEVIYDHTHKKASGF